MLVADHEALQGKKKGGLAGRPLGVAVCLG
jgi:hypothetical protein